MPRSIPRHRLSSRHAAALPLVLGIPLVGLLLLLGSASRAQDLVTNGSFESGADPGAFLFALGPGDASIDGWTIEAGTIDYIGTQWQASDGGRSIDMSGVGGTAGVISQTIPTQIGVDYVLVFDLAGNPGGAPAVKSLRVSVPGRSVDFQFDAAGQTLPDMGWVTRVVPFTATDTTTTIRFESLTSSGFGPALDQVRVQADLVSNGSFEVGPNPGAFTRVGGTTIPDWTITINTIDYVGTGWVASDGARSLDLAGSDPGSIHQDIATEIGRSYTIYFDLAGNFAGAPAVKQLRLMTPSGPADFLFDVTGRSATAMGWQTVSSTFRASQTISRIRLTALNGAGGYGPAVDNVHVVASSGPGVAGPDADRDGIVDARDKCPDDPTPHVFVASDDQTTASFPDDFPGPRAERTELRFTRGAIPEPADGGPQYLTCGIDFGSLAGGEGRITHLQDIALIGDRSDGSTRIFASHSQNFGGHLFVLEAGADVPPNEEGVPDAGLVDGQGVWYRRLDSQSVEGPYNHPGDLSVVGDVVSIAGQNWDGGPGVDLFDQPLLNVCRGQLALEPTRQMQISDGTLVSVAEPDAILFYDVSDPTFPEFLGKIFVASLPQRPDLPRTPLRYGGFTGYTAARVGDHVYIDVDGRWYRSPWMSWHADDWMPILDADVPVIPARGYARVKDATLETNSWGVNLSDPPSPPPLVCLGSACSWGADPLVQYDVERIGSLPATRTFDLRSEIIDCATQPTGPFTREFVGCRAGETDMFVSPSGRMQLAIAEAGFGSSDYCSLASTADAALCTQSILVESYTNAPVAQVAWAGGTPEPLPPAACHAPRFSVLDALAPGDGLVTRDDATGLDWLDLTQTVGLSVDAIRGGSGDWYTMGWRVATAAQICELLGGATAGFGIDCAAIDPLVPRSASGAETPDRFDGLLSMLGFTRTAIAPGDAFGPEGGGEGGEITAIGYPSIGGRPIAPSHVDQGNSLGAPGFALLPCDPDAETGWCEARGLYDRGDGSYGMASLSRGLAKCNAVDLRQCQDGMIFGFTSQSEQSTCKKCALMNDAELCPAGGCASDAAYVGAGSFLVRVPEPRGTVLAWSGMVALMALARRRGDRVSGRAGGSVRVRSEVAPASRGT